MIEVVIYLFLLLEIIILLELTETIKHVYNYYIRRFIHDYSIYIITTSLLIIILFSEQIVRLLVKYLELSSR